jgi:hypothetical protein
MDIGKSFSFPFEDEKWLSKLVIGAIVSAIPIVNIIFAGYIVDTIRNVMAGLARPLPEWVDWGDKFMKGLILFLASLVYSIPVIASRSWLLPDRPFNAQNNQNMQEALGWFTSVSDPRPCFSPCTVWRWFLPAGSAGKPRSQGTFTSCFEFGEIMASSPTTWAKYLTAWLVFW